MQRFFHILTGGFLALLVSCFPGGFVIKGGHVDQAGWIPEATLTNNAPYQVVCPDKEELERRQQMKEEGLSVPKEPAIKLVSPKTYSGGCEQTASSSVYYLLHLFPATPPMDAHYALGLAVQKLEGDTMINIKTWHETHYYSLLGHVRVFKIKGDVIRFEQKDKKGQR
ncbi:MAG: hypothetical protein KDK25_04755 [Leptospiraceae bacterium]|nr:hypothetical protein [Leptospiraceae bacterium]